MGFASYLEDILDGKFGSELIPVPNVERNPNENDVPAGEVDSYLARIAQEKQSTSEEIQRLERELNELNRPHDPLSSFISRLPQDRLGPLSPSGQKREAVRQQIRSRRERMKKLKESERWLEQIRASR
jgi:hypothetical protein